VSGEAPGMLVPPPAEAAVIDILRSAADALAADLATWAARDPGNPSPEARQARRAAIATAWAVANAMSGLQARLEGGRS